MNTSKLEEIIFKKMAIIKDSIDDLERDLYLLRSKRIEEIHEIQDS